MGSLDAEHVLVCCRIFLVSLDNETCTKWFIWPLWPFSALHFSWTCDSSTLELTCHFHSCTWTVVFSLPENPASCEKKARCQSTCKYAPPENEHLPPQFRDGHFHLPSTTKYFSGDIRKRFSGEPLVQDWTRKTSMWMCQQQKLQWLPWLCRSLKSNCHLWCGIPGSWIRGNGKILSLKYWNYANIWW